MPRLLASFAGGGYSGLAVSSGGVRAVSRGSEPGGSAYFLVGAGALAPAAGVAAAPEALSWLLDTDVLSQPAKRRGDARVVAWLERERDRCYTSAVVIAQLAYWVRSKEGHQRTALQAWLTRLTDAMHGRIHGFNVSVAHVWAEQEPLLERTGRRMPVEDSYIAATARRHDLTIATGNDRDFRRPGLKVFNPFKELPAST